MVDVKWSDNTSFPSVGTINPLDSIMGLQSGNNVKWHFSTLLANTSLQSVYNASSPPLITFSSGGGLTFLNSDSTHNFQWTNGSNTSWGKFNVISTSSASVINFVPGAASSPTQFACSNTVDQGVNNPSTLFTFNGATPTRTTNIATSSIGFNYDSIAFSESAFLNFNILSNGVLNSLINIYGQDASNPVRLIIGGTNSSTSHVESVSINVGIGGAFDYTALLQVNSSTQGVLFPRLTSSQQITLVSQSPSAGVEWYNSTNNTKNFYDGSIVQEGLTIQHLLGGTNITITNNLNGTATINGSVESVSWFPIITSPIGWNGSPNSIQASYEVVGAYINCYICIQLTVTDTNVSFVIGNPVTSNFTTTSQAQLTGQSFNNAISPSPFDGIVNFVTSLIGNNGVLVTMMSTVGSGNKTVYFAYRYLVQ